MTKNGTAYLQNPLWQIKPSVAFLPDKGPVFLTSWDNDGGNPKRFIHPPSHPMGNFPIPNGDQLAPTVAQCRTIKPVRAHHFSQTYSMLKMQGMFSGVDTLDVRMPNQYEHSNTEQAHTMIKFVHVPTIPLEERPAFDKTKPSWCSASSNPPPNGTGRAITSDPATQRLGPYRYGETKHFRGRTYYPYRICIIIFVKS